MKYSFINKLYRDLQCQFLNNCPYKNKKLPKVKTYDNLNLQFEDKLIFAQLQSNVKNRRESKKEKYDFKQKVVYKDSPQILEYVKELEKERNFQKYIVTAINKHKPAKDLFQEKKIAL